MIYIALAMLASLTVDIYSGLFDSQFFPSFAQCRSRLGNTTSFKVACNVSLIFTLCSLCKSPSMLKLMTEENIVLVLLTVQKFFHMFDIQVPWYKTFPVALKMISD